MALKKVVAFSNVVFCAVDQTLIEINILYSSVVWAFEKPKVLLILCNNCNISTIISNVHCICICMFDCIDFVYCFSIERKLLCLVIRILGLEVTATKIYRHSKSKCILRNIL